MKQTDNSRSIEGLRESRVRYRDEMRQAIACSNVNQKRNLVLLWKAKYSALMVKELISLAKVSEIREAVSHWET